jgi:hypothetical protein
MLAGPGRREEGSSDRSCFQISLNKMFNCRNLETQANAPLLQNLPHFGLHLPVFLIELPQ